MGVEPGFYHLCRAYINSEESVLDDCYLDGSTPCVSQEVLVHRKQCDWHQCTRGIIRRHTQVPLQNGCMGEDGQRRFSSLTERVPWLLKTCIHETIRWPTASAHLVSSVEVVWISSKINNYVVYVHANGDKVSKDIADERWNMNFRLLCDGWFACLPHILVRKSCSSGNIYWLSRKAAGSLLKMCFSVSFDRLFEEKSYWERREW